MTDLGDFDLRSKADEEAAPPSAPPEDRSLVIAAVVAVLVVAAGLVGYFSLSSRPAPTPTPTAASPATPTPIPDPEVMGLPSLDRSDGFARELAKGLSPHPLLGLWLGEQGLVRLLANVVDFVSKGESPRASLGFLAPKGAFEVARRGGRIAVDEKSYARYDFFAEGAASIDAAAGAAAFRRALPLFEAAYRELGYPQGGFERALREAIAHLLATPVVAGDVTLQPARRGTVLVYEYADPVLEALSPAQKHLLRMGPSNVQRIQGALRAFLSALGS